MKKINQYTRFHLFLFCVIFLSSCIPYSSRKLANNNLKNNVLIQLPTLKNGDLIFVGTTNDGLSGAINRVTQKTTNRNYDHVGIIEKTSDSIFVLHAAPKGGSQREEIHQFYHNQKNTSNTLVIYRLNNQFQHVIPNAIHQAKAMLGKPYNWTYILNENAYYCSDFIERAFKNDKIFEMIPMNFKNPKTGEIDDFWIEFYKKQNLEVPQDYPGTNPNQLAESNKLIEIGALFIEQR